MEKNKFSKSWRSSKQPRKQRLFRLRAPLHLRHKLVASHLSPELRKKHGKRSIAVKQDDKVKVMRGNFKGHVGKVERVDRRAVRVFVRGAESVKKDGTKSFYPLHPSKLMIMELNLKDKRRVAALKRKKV